MQRAHGTGHRAQGTGRRAKGTGRRAQQRVERDGARGREGERAKR